MKGKSKLKRMNIGRRDLRMIFSMTGFNENFDNKSKESKM